MCIRDRCINNTCNETTGYTPSELFLNKEPVHVWTKTIKRDVYKRQDLERDLKRVNNQLNNHPRGDYQEPTFYPTRRRDNERPKEKRFTPYPGNKPQYRQELEEKGGRRSVETRPSKGFKVCKTAISSTEPQPSTSKTDTGNGKALQVEKKQN